MISKNHKKNSNKIVSVKLFFLFTLFLFSCSSDDGLKKEVYDPQLPAITSIGANTFGCKINGIIMVPRNSIGYIPPGSNHYPIISSKGINSEYMYIQAADLRETKRGAVFLYLQNFTTNNYFQVGEYNIFEGISPSFLNDNYNNYMYVSIEKNGLVNNYKSVTNSGKIIITKNDNNILSGTFYCKVKNVNNSNDIIDITDGRFDFSNTINTTNFP